MFKNDLRQKLERIFGFEKTTLNAYSDEFEQDTLFVEIEYARTRVSGNDHGLSTARVIGHLVVFSQDNKLPFGYFIKRIEQARPEDKEAFFFYDIDTDRPDSPARMQNIHERRVSFSYFYKGQYDPDKGQLSELDTTII